MHLDIKIYENIKKKNRRKNATCKNNKNVPWN